MQQARKKTAGVSSAGDGNFSAERLRFRLVIQVNVSCRCLHSLIALSLPGGVSEVEARVLEELWDYYDEALAIISAAVSQHQSCSANPLLPPPLPSRSLQQNFSLLYN